MVLTWHECGYREEREDHLRHCERKHVDGMTFYEVYTKNLSDVAQQ